MADIGERTEQIQWRQQSRTLRSDGGYDTSPTTAATIWAAVRPVSARENEIAGRLAGQTTYLVTIERDDLPSGYGVDDSLVWATAGNAVLNIREIRLPSPHMMTVEIVAESGVVE